MKICPVVFCILGVAWLAILRPETADAHELQWLRWLMPVGAVQHIIVNDSSVPKALTVGSVLNKPCDTVRYLNPDTRFSDKRFSSRTIFLELKPSAWIALWTPTPEQSIGCRAELWFANDGNEASSTGSSVELTGGVDFIDILPFEPGEVHADTSVVIDDLVQVSEQPGVRLQVQVRVRNLSPDDRIFAITRRALKCRHEGQFDWVVGPGEAPVEIASGPIPTKPKLAAVFSQRLRGYGDPHGCTASFTIAEERRPFKEPIVIEEVPVWAVIKELNVSLTPTVKAFYR